MIIGVVIGAVAAVAIAVGGVMYFGGLGESPADVSASTAPSKVPSTSPAAADSPEAAAESLATAFLDALVAGDVTGATGMLAPAETASARVLLNDAVYQAAGHPTEYALTSELAVDGDVADISAAVTIEGQRYLLELSMERDSARTGDFDGWHIANDALATIRVSDVRNVTQINGTPVDLAGVAPGSTLVALPGAYRFAAPTANPNLAYGADQSVVALPSVSAEVFPFTAVLSEQGKQTAVNEVNARISHCMLSDAFRPADCPNVLEMKDPGIYATTNITRTWRVSPSVALVEMTPGSNGSLPTYGVNVSGGDMHLAYEWRYAEGDDWQPDDFTSYAVFDRRNPAGTLVAVSVDASGQLSLDYSGF